MSATIAETEIYLADVFLLCVECGEPIKARINTQQWIRVEWIGPEGECLKCYQEKKANNGKRPANNISSINHG